MADLRIALLGKIGSGKSSTGNTLLGRNAFGENFSPQAVTQTCKIHSSVVNGRRITVIDSPGLFNPSMSERRVEGLMERCANLSFPGLHVFLLVIRLDVELTEKEKIIMKWIKTNFGEDAARYTFILFTHADALNTPLDDFIRESQHLQTLIDSCGGRYHTFNNKERLNQDQVTMLIEKIDRMVQRNGAHHSTAKDFREAQERIKIFEIGASVAVAGAAAAAIIALLVMAKLEQH